MKKLFLGIFLIVSMHAHSMTDATLWKGAPEVFTRATQDKEVLAALENVDSSVQALAAVYAEKLAHQLTPQQKEQCVMMLTLFKAIIIKAQQLAGDNGNVLLQQEIQELGQKLYMACAPLIFSMQTESVSTKGLLGSNKGYDMSIHAMEAMINALRK